MKLKKIASLMLAGVMAVSMLAGCSGKTETKPEGEGNNEGTTASGYSAMLGEKAAETLKKADKDELFTFADDADDQKALEKVVRGVKQSDILDYVENYTVDNFGKVAGAGVRATMQDNFQNEADVTREIGTMGWYTNDGLNTSRIGDVWVANGNISMDNVMSSIFDSYKDMFKNAPGEATWTSGGNLKISYAYDVAVSVVNVPLSAYNEYAGSVNFIAVTVTRTADYV